MRTIVKKDDGSYFDENTNQAIDENKILVFIKNDEEFEIVNEKQTKITDQELARILRRRTRMKSEPEKFFDSVKGLFETGKSTATQMFQDLTYVGYGAMVTTEEKARKWIDQLIDSGKISKEKGEELFNKAKENFQEREKQFEQKAKEVLQKKLGDLGIASVKDLEDKINSTVSETTNKLENELDKLRKQVETLTKGQKE